MVAKYAGCADATLNTPKPAGCQVVVEIGGTPISAAHMEQMISPRKNWKRRRGDTILLAANAPNPTSQHIGQL
jgi:hypothetical protein